MLRFPTKIEAQKQRWECFTIMLLKIQPQMRKSVFFPFMNRNYALNPGSVILFVTSGGNKR